MIDSHYCIHFKINKGRCQEIVQHSWYMLLVELARVKAPNGCSRILECSPRGSQHHHGGLGNHQKHRSSSALHLYILVLFIFTFRLLLRCVYNVVYNGVDKVFQHQSYYRCPLTSTSVLRFPPPPSYHLGRHITHLFYVTCSNKTK